MFAQLSLAVLALGTILASASPAPTPSPCSNDTFPIDGRPVAVALCAVEGSAHRSTDGHRIVVTIAETLSSGPTSFTRDVTLDFLAGAEVSRTIDDVPLAKLGMERTLHLTIGYRSDSIRLEHALLVPGAIPLK
jgi:hypothetical protein